jgi:hypothetical protein
VTALDCPPKSAYVSADFAEPDSDWRLYDLDVQMRLRDVPEDEEFAARFAAGAEEVWLAGGDWVRGSSQQSSTVIPDWD